ncbi:MAG: ribosome biogenesis GTPase Der [Victivallales bacterium]|nr:ribosome biogenesis GTPase Der [Victivallales bacterium]
MNEENINIDKPAPEKFRIPTIAIVGRPNVGKSSLFNAIIKRRLAIVHEASGVTRDRIVSPAIRHGKHFQVIDTGGLGTFAGEERKVDMWDRNIRAQVEIAIEGADVLVLVVNVQQGVVPLDEEVADRLRECGKKVIVAVNKVDDGSHQKMVPEFSRLGYEDLFPVSCLHRQGIDELLEKTLEDFEAYENIPERPQALKIAAVGRPNVGKSSLINRLLGEKRVMVSEIAGTTRDSVDVDFELKIGDEKLPATLIDTAGLRKRGKVSDAIEMFSVMRAQSAIERANIVLFLVEAKPEGVTAQDKKIASIIHDSGKACIIVANKWDICENKDPKAVLDELRYSLPGMSYAPVVFASALDGKNMDKLMDMIGAVIEQLEVHVSTSMVNRVVEDAIQRNAPPVVGTSRLKIYYTTMVGSAPPTFLLFVNNPKLCAKNYLAYLNNYFREAFGFFGIPIIIRLRERPKNVESIRTRQTAREAIDKMKKSRRASGSKRVNPNLKGTKGMKAKRKIQRGQK